jgi:hypothetical protein
MKTFLAVLVLLAIGGGLAWVGYNQTQSQEVTCGGQVMSPGDVCESSNGTSNNYDEEKASQQSSGWIGVGIGGVVVALGVVVLVGAVVRRGRPAAATG